MGERAPNGLLASKVYKLENVKAMKAAPVLEGALRNANPGLPVECVAMENVDSVLVSVPVESLPLADALVKSLETALVSRNEPPADLNSYNSYRPRFISSSATLRIIAHSQGGKGGAIYSDPASGTIYWRGSGTAKEEVERLLKAQDVPQHQVRLILKLYKFEAKAVDRLAAAFKAAPASYENAGAKLLSASIKSRWNVERLAEAECAIAQGINSSSAFLDAGRVGRFKISANYPVVEELPSGGLSAYIDFLFDLGSEQRTSRLSLLAGAEERPLAVFASGWADRREGASYLDLSKLYEVFRGKDERGVPRELFVVTGAVLAAGR